MAELSEVGSCRNTRKLGQHKGAAHKLALLNGRPHEFISGGEDGLIMGLDVRNSEPDKLIVQVSTSIFEPSRLSLYVLAFMSAAFNISSSS